MFTTTYSIEWYQRGNPKFLDWDNYNDAVAEPGKYKFVKFFTHSCKYCRMLKQVEEKLIQERDWGFRFYDVDCSLNHDLCQAAANIKGYPFVAIYNTQGQF